MVPIECVARGYLTGSGWAEYQESGTVCGIALPAGLLDGSRLPEPIFTPATKAELGEHDENIDFAGVVERVGRELAEQLRSLTLSVYRRADEVARQRGLIVADTKVEFGRRRDGTRGLGRRGADPGLVPVLGRRGLAAGRPTHPVRQAAGAGLVAEGVGLGSQRGRAATTATPEIVAATRERYVEAYERLTGQPLVEPAALSGRR